VQKAILLLRLARALNWAEAAPWKKYASPCAPAK